MAALSFYLDSCALQRPLDALRTAAESAEAECVVALLVAAAAGQIELIWSSALDHECIQRIPATRLEWTETARRIARRSVRAGPSTVERARLIASKLRLTALDALHVACAEEARAALVTVDARLLARCTRGSRMLGVPVIDPMAAAALARGALGEP